MRKYNMIQEMSMLKQVDWVNEICPTPQPPAKAVKQSIYTYQVERFVDIIPEFAPFIKIHWDELALTKQEVPVDFDWARYIQMDTEGKLHIVTVRRAGVLIGYHISLIGKHLHYKSTMHAHVDVYYLLKEYRTGRIGAKLIVNAEEALRAAGVKKIYTGCKSAPEHDRTRLFEALGYTKSDYSFIKIIG